ncbi:MAG: flagellar biosynthesis anti-sigma factor FlgM [Candidatus Hydrogenedentes bacterium]|nr:flagellar biosynthesis anti-sigma factor FlgM [Candidatus Hydrogenedentota bacterium]
MVGVHGVGGVPEPAPERPVNVRDKRRDEAVASSSAETDDVLISSEAQAAAKLTALVALAKQSDVRQDRVDQAKQALEQGTYKHPDVVSELAQRISKFL